MSYIVGNRGTSGTKHSRMSVIGEELLCGGEQSTPAVIISNNRTLGRDSSLMVVSIMVSIICRSITIHSAQLQNRWSLNVNVNNQTTKNSIEYNNGNQMHVLGLGICNTI